jgi:ElaB/YqjD/DUF883 family membrane-anchored ribosome-binding protein
VSDGSLRDACIEEKRKRKEYYIMSRADSGNTPSQGAASQLRDKASEVATNLRDMGSQVRDAATEKYENIKESASEYYQAGRDKAVQWENQIEEYVREQPIKSLLMAAGVGILLGVLWKRS